MAEMAIGYGSEFQLLRYLGHHRKYLNLIILQNLGLDGDINWFDYPVDEKRDSMDGEYKGIEFLKGHLSEERYKRVAEEWKNFWPQRGNSQNWDGIFELNGKYYLVEAKAHLEEAHQKCQAGDDSRRTIKNAFAKTCGDNDLAQEWLNSNCYQLANRLAFIEFCKQNSIDAELVYICFYNGYRRNPKKNLQPELREWENEMKQDIDSLKLSNTLKNKIHIVCIDCLEPRK